MPKNPREESGRGWCHLDRGRFKFRRLRGFQEWPYRLLKAEHIRVRLGRLLFWPRLGLAAGLGTTVVNGARYVSILRLLSFPAAAAAYAAERLFGPDLIPQTRWHENQLFVSRGDEFGQAQLNGDLLEAVI